MNKNTIRNIIFAILGAILLGLGIDIVSWTVGISGVMLMIITFVLAMKEILDD